MRTKRTSILLFLSIITMLALAVLPQTVRADDFYYTWDSATHGTKIIAPLGQIGSIADAYADATGLTKVHVYGGFGFTGYAEAWADLYITLNGEGKYVKPIINYEVKGRRFNGGTAKINLTCIDRATGETIGEWSQDLPNVYGSDPPITETLTGNFFWAQSGREYLYWVRVYAWAPITINAEVDVDYLGTDAIPRYVKVNYLSIIQYTGGGCPTLFVWNGTDYAEEGILDIHAESDVTVQHEIQNTLALQKGVYKLQLKELDNFTSHIDQVKLYAVDYQGKWNLCPLTYAYHNELGKVTWKLFFDDEKRVDLTPTQIIDLKFLPSIPYRETAHFIFEINGYNVKVP